MLTLRGITREARRVRLLPHNPTGSRDAVARQLRYANCLRQYTDVFKQTPPAEFWPGDASEVTTETVSPTPVAATVCTADEHSAVRSEFSVVHSVNGCATESSISTNSTGDNKSSRTLNSSGGSHNNKRSEYIIGDDSSFHHNDELEEETESESDVECTFSVASAAIPPALVIDLTRNWPAEAMKISSADALMVLSTEVEYIIPRNQSELSIVSATATPVLEPEVALGVSMVDSNVTATAVVHSASTSAAVATVVSATTADVITETIVSAIAATTNAAAAISNKLDAPTSTEISATISSPAAAEPALVPTIVTAAASSTELLSEAMKPKKVRKSRLKQRRTLNQ